MANKPLKSITFPGLSDTYTVPQVDNTLLVSGAAADAKATGDAINELKSDLSVIKEITKSVHTGSAVINTDSVMLTVLCPVKTGDLVSVLPSYTGAEVSVINIWAYDTDNNLNLLKENNPFDVAYIFTASKDYKSFYMQKTSATVADNETISAVITVEGQILTDIVSIKDVNTSQQTAINRNTDDISKLKTGNDNVYSGMNLILGRVYAGVYSDAITTVHCTDYIPLVPGRTYAIYGGYLDANYTNYYDEDKVYKGSLPLTGLVNSYPFGNSNNFLVFTAPANARYTRINFLNSDLVNGTDLKPAWFFRDITNDIWAQKKVLVIGDSISTDVYGNYKKWVTDLIDDGYLSIGYVKNNSQHATGFVATYNGSESTRFLARLQTETATNYDALIVFGGINDFIQSIDFDTFKTAVDNFFAYVAEHYYHARICVFTPLRTSVTTANSAGHIQQDYSDYIKTVAKSYCLPILNLTEDSGFFPFIDDFRDTWTLLPSGYNDHDGVHPTEEYEKQFLTPMIRHFLDGMF